VFLYLVRSISPSVLSDPRDKRTKVDMVDKIGEMGVACLHIPQNAAYTVIIYREGYLWLVK